jgi:Family of unknown function (DUF6152)
MVMKYTLAILLGIATVLTLGSSPTPAHHAFYSVYDRDKTVKIEGTLKEFIWRNPHSFVRVEAPDEKGETQSWVIEWAAPAQLTEKGLTSTTLRPGDKIVVTGHPGRVAENHRLQLMKVERPSDGWKWEGNIQ